MKFYIFSTGIEEVEELYNSGYSGALFIYHANQNDFFTQISKHIVLGKDFKYMVAIRPHAISPQYLCMINNSIDSIEANRLQINFVTGWLQDNEKEFGGILGEVNDLSPNIDRSNYLINYIDELEKLKTKTPDYYISTTNKFVFNAGSKHNSKMIIPYSQYLDKRYDLNNKKIMISITPTLIEEKQETNYVSKNKKSDEKMFTFEEFNMFIDELKNKGIDEVMITQWKEKEKKAIHNFVKQYKEKENK